MVKHGARACNIGHVRGDGRTVFMSACERKTCHSWALEVLRSEPEACRLGQVGKGGETALTLACKYVAADVAWAMVERHVGDCCIGQVNSEQDTALILAVKAFMSKVAKKIVHSGSSACKLGHANAKGMTALMTACKYGDDALACQMLAHGKEACNVDCVSNKGQTVLSLACQSHLSGTILCLLAFGAEVCKLHVVDPVAKKTPLMLACEGNLGEVVRNMLTFGAEACAFTYTNRKHESAFTIACRHHKTQAALRMIEWNMDACNAASKKYYSCALYAACRMGAEDIAKFLLDTNAGACGLPEQAFARLRHTPLMWACKLNMEAVALRLLDLGLEECKMNMINKDGKTAFYFACVSGMKGAANRMLDMDAKTCVKYAFRPKLCVLQYVCENNMPDVALRLLEGFEADKMLRMKSEDQYFMVRCIHKWIGDNNDDVRYKKKWEAVFPPCRYMPTLYW